MHAEERKHIYYLNLELFQKNQVLPWILEWSYKSKWTIVQIEFRFNVLKSISFYKIQPKLNGITILIHLQITRISQMERKIECMRHGDTQRLYRLFSEIFPFVTKEEIQPNVMFPFVCMDWIERANKHCKWRVLYAQIFCELLEPVFLLIWHIQFDIHSVQMLQICSTLVHTRSEEQRPPHSIIWIKVTNKIIAFFYLIHNLPPPLSLKSPLINGLCHSFGRCVCGHFFSCRVAVIGSCL